MRKCFTIFAVLFCACFVIAGCGTGGEPKAEKETGIDEIKKVDVGYYNVCPPKEKSDYKTFYLTDEQMKEFRKLFPAKIHYVDTKIGVDCGIPEGAFSLELVNGEKISFHFCSSKGKLHGKKGFVLVPEGLYEFFIKAVEQHQGKKLSFGTGIK